MSEEYVHHAIGDSACVGGLHCLCTKHLQQAIQGTSLGSFRSSWSSLHIQTVHAHSKEASYFRYRQGKLQAGQGGGDQGCAA